MPQVRNTLSLPDEVWEEMKAQARAENRSLSNMVHTVWLQWKLMRSSEKARRPRSNAKTAA